MVARSLTSMFCAGSARGGHTAGGAWGTGLPPESIETLIALGVAKLNYGTLLKQAFLASLQQTLPRYHPPMSPHEFLGMGGNLDVLVAARDAVKAKVKELLRLCGSAGRSYRYVHK